MSNLIGKSIGRFHITEQLGRGGMAIVYKAYDTHLEREVAIKLIRKEAFSPDALERVLKRFDREAKALARLSHTNIINIHDYGNYQGSPYLVMEYMPGGSLKDILDNPMKAREAARLLAPVAKALAHSHQEGIIHRDIKPSNILIDKNGAPKLTDFGIARILDASDEAALTGTGVGVGTPEYMTPEQGLGKEVDRRTDVYSLGVVFFEMVTGEKPYEADTPLAVVVKHIHDALPSPTSISPGLPKQIEQAIFKAMAKNPENRFQDMNTFALALDQIDQGFAGKLDDDLTQDEFDLRGDIGENKTPHRRSRIPWIIGGSIAIIIVLAGIILFLSDTSIIPGVKSTSLQDTITANVPTPLVDTLTNTVGPTSTSTATPLPPSPTAPPLGIGFTQVSDIDGMEMVYIPAGSFEMGSNETTDEQPIHDVYLDAYWIDQTEVTNAMFSEFTAATGYQTDADLSGKSRVYIYGEGWQLVEGASWQFPRGPSSNISGLGDRPVAHISWNDALAYCVWAGRQLPTEAQWEKAARGKDGRIYPWGNQELAGNLLNFADKRLDTDWVDVDVDDGYTASAPVGSYPDGASPYGVLDMAGNVWEWVVDYYAADYYNNSPESNPQGPTSGFLHVIRGGSWSSDFGGLGLRSTKRGYGNPDDTWQSYGFRCAQDATQ